MRSRASTSSPQVKGIGLKTVEKNRDLIEVGGRAGGARRTAPPCNSGAADRHPGIPSDSRPPPRADRARAQAPDATSRCRTARYTAAHSVSPRTRMILPQYRVDASTIPGAGQGVFVAERVARGRIVVAPDAIPRRLRWDEARAAGSRRALASTSAGSRTASRCAGLARRVLSSTTRSRRTGCGTSASCSRRATSRPATR